MCEGMNILILIDFVRNQNFEFEGMNILRNQNFECVRV